jgi:hypothetical protein
MGKAPASAVVLDSGALIALERGDARMRALCREALKIGATLMVPAGVVAQVMRNRARQAVVRALLNSPNTRVPPLDRVLSEACGELCGRVGTHDIVDASVVLVARRERAPIVTSDIDDLRQLDPSVRPERI